MNFIDADIDYPHPLPQVSRGPTKNIRVLVEGRLEYRDVPIDIIFEVCVVKFHRSCTRRDLNGINTFIDDRIAFLYYKLVDLANEFPKLGYRLPSKPEWLT